MLECYCLQIGSEIAFPLNLLSRAGLGLFLFLLMIRSNKHKSEHMMHEMHESHSSSALAGDWLHDRDPQTSPVYIELLHVGSFVYLAST
jgi:hypothetical protein